MIDWIVLYVCIMLVWIFVCFVVRTDSSKYAARMALLTPIWPVAVVVFILYWLWRGLVKLVRTAFPSN